MRIRPRLRPWMLVSAAWIVPAAFAALDRYAQPRLNGWDPATPHDLLWASGDWFLYAFLTPAVFAVSRRLPLARPHLVRRALQHLAISLLFCAAWATCGKILQMVLGLAFEPARVYGAIASAGDQYYWNLFRDWLAWIFTTLPFGVAVYLCVVGVEHAMRYFVDVQEREVQMARLSEQLSGARFAALQAQLNPHFLFNTLNTITVLVRDGDRAGATRMVEQLSDILRRTLSRHRANEVALGDEMELVRQYLSIEQARFSDRLRLEFDIDETILSAAVPSFALQHLVENAIRHGIARHPDAERVRVTARRDHDMLELSVIDDGAGIVLLAEIPDGHGIDSTRERLRALYADRASLVVERAPSRGTVATLRIPFREMIVESDVGER